MPESVGNFPIEIHSYSSQVCVKIDFLLLLHTELELAGFSALFIFHSLLILLDPYAYVYPWKRTFRLIPSLASYTHILRYISCRHIPHRYPMIDSPRYIHAHVLDTRHASRFSQALQYLSPDFSNLRRTYVTNNLCI